MQNFSKEQLAEWHEAKNPTPVKKKPKVVEPAEDVPYIFEVKDSE
jgi:hypothetical protein